jgi:glucose/mannose-6-phosphate isomerase
MPVPLVVHKGVVPPSFGDRTTLVGALSASGNAPETVAAATTAVDDGGRLFAITSGGALGALADAKEAPTVFLPVAETPVPPRVRVGALAVPILTAFERLGFFPGARDWIAAAIDQLVARRQALVVDGGGLAGDLARNLAGTIPIVYGAGSLGWAAATRWKDQVNQTAKSPSWVGEVPEVVHGELAGWGQHGDITRQVMSMVLLRHDEEAPELDEHFGVIEEWSDEVMAGIHTVRAEGEGALAQLLDLAFVGDVVALELAERYGIDPGPTPVLSESPAVVVPTPTS